MSITVITPPTGAALTTATNFYAATGVVSGTDTALIGVLIDAASNAIADHCQRTFGVEKVSEHLPGSGRLLLPLTQVPIVSIDSIYEDDTNLVTDYEIQDAASGAIYREIGWAPARLGGWDLVAYSGTWDASGYIIPALGRLRFTATYTGGYVLPGQTGPTLPKAVEQACIETVKVMYANRAPAVGAVRQVQVGDRRVEYAIPVTGLPAIPPLAETLLRPYNRAWLMGI